MASPPDAHNSAHGDMHGNLVQARDIHGDITLHTPQAPPEIPDVSLDPPRPATTVRGRDRLLETLRNAMVRGAPVPHVLTGPGGFGKTTVAAALAEHARAKGWTVFWVRPDVIAAGMVAAAIEVGGSRSEAEQLRNAPRQAARWAWQRLDAASRPWLLVIDDADRPEELDPEHRPGEQRGWMRSSPGGFVLVTSRVNDRGLWAPAHLHRVDALSVEDAADALADHAETEEPRETRTLADRLGGVPLALSLAGRILTTHRALFPDPRSLLEHLDGDVSRMDELATPLARGGTHERQLLSGVWDLSLRLVGEDHPLAIPLLRKLALMGSRGHVVPLWRLPKMDKTALSHAADSLASHGLIEFTMDRGEVALLLHPLIAETVVAGLTGDDTSLVLEVETLLEEQGDRDPRFEVAAHTTLLSLAERLPTLGTGYQARMSLTLAAVLLRTGRHDAAEDAAESARRGAESALGPDDPLTLQARHLLAETWLFQDRVADAQREYLDLLADRERVLGREDPRTLDTRFQIALVKGLRGEWERARRQYEEILSVRLRVQAPDAPGILDSMDALGYTALRTGDLDTAERLFEEVHEIRLRTLGASHRQTLNADYKRGLIALGRGAKARAHEIFRHVLEVRTRTLGPHHPQTRLVRDRVRGVSDPLREARHSGGSSS